MTDNTTDKVDLSDVQGLIMKGYGRMPYAAYLMLHFNNPEKAGKWLEELEVTNASTSSGTIDSAVNIAFTYEGLHTLGIEDAASKTFPREFVEGMVTPHRQRVLYDFGESDPANWEWGGKKDTKAIHAVLILFSTMVKTFNSLEEVEKTKLASSDIEVVKQLDTNFLPDKKEHFGFRDGVAQPVMKNADRDEEEEHPGNLISPGEFIFGYINEYDKYIDSPNISAELDPDNILMADKVNPERKDLGRNGSMMVFRHLQQDVVKFWQFLDKASKEQQVEGTSASKEALGAKMVGRWMNGSPLTKCPYEPDEKYREFDKFGYGEHDFDGFKCPIGSHIRRANPRDNFVRNSSGDKEKDMENSQKYMKRFRILRRGRTYGEPISSSFDPDEVIHSDVKDKNRGLYFICFNTNIGRQFELIQQTWINNPKFAGLYDDPDPLTGAPEIMGEGATTTFTEQAQPLRKKVKGIPRFVEVRGGAYFFMPGLKGLKFLSVLSRKALNKAAE